MPKAASNGWPHGHLLSAKSTSPTDMASISTYDFTGDAVTFLGLIGIVSTAYIMVTVYRRYWNSPYRK
jgi:hypothetical protein